jgi:hypothetical protein
MSFNKRWVRLDQCIQALKEGKLREYFGKSDMLLFDNNTCSTIYHMYIQGKPDSEILDLVEKNQK